MQMFFDAFDGLDPNGTALGELETLEAKTVQVEWNAVGSGQFTINRNSVEVDNGWTATGNLVRVRLEPGGPFDYDDPSYIFAFWLDQGTDIVLSSDEEGGETLTRGGRGIMSVLDRAVLYWYQRHDPPTVSSRPYLELGVWKWHNNGLGQILLRLLSEDGAKDDPGPALPFVTKDFDSDIDTDGNAWRDWDDGDAWFQLEFGLDYLTCVEKLRAEGLTVNMTPAMTMQAWQDYTNPTSGVTFAAGANIVESGQINVFGGAAKSRMIVQGTVNFAGATKYREVVDSGVETNIGRREGFYPYNHTPDEPGLDAAGQFELDRLSLRREGPTSIGVLADGLDAEGNPVPVPFTDYFPGNFVEVQGFGDGFDAVEVQAITLDENEAGEVDVGLQFRDGVSPRTVAVSAASPKGGGCQCPCNLGDIVPGTDDLANAEAPAYLSQVYGPVHVGTATGLDPETFQMIATGTGPGSLDLPYVKGTLGVFVDDKFVFVPLADQLLANSQSFDLHSQTGEVYAWARLSCEYTPGGG